MTLRIIDVASHQAGILPSTVDCDGALVKATGGNNYINPACDPVMQDLYSHNMPSGVYHFAHEYGNINDAKEEADYFIQNIQGYIGKSLLALDYEIAMNGRTYTNEDVEWCKQFIQEVIDKTGVIPIIYMSKSVTNATNWQAVIGQNVALWVAQYATDTATGWQIDPWVENNNFGGFTVALHQFTSHGRINGWNADLDLNLFYGDKEAWNKFANTKQATAKPEETGAGYLSEFADDVLKGKYGNGQARKDNIYNAVQGEVDKKLNK